MSSITVYGASDDLIEIEGGLREEFEAADGSMNYLAFSDGTVLSVVYGKDGLWTLRRVVTGTASFSKHDATDEDEDYSDRVTLDGNILWVVCGTRFERIAETTP